jgi:HEAT repeat protein
MGNLPESILSEKDNFPLPRELVVEAVGQLTNDYQGLEVVLAQFDIAQPLLRQAYASAPEQQKLVYAHILGMMGDATGAETLASVVSSKAWDEGWRYTGMGQFGPSMSPLDSLIIALGRTKSAVAVKPIVEKVGLLGPNSEFSHFRAIAIALETLGDKSAAQPLAELMQKPGLSGHAVTTIEKALEVNPRSSTDTSVRNQALSELYLARALYRCGDYEGLGQKTLREYAQDLHGHYARHAKAVLKPEAKSVE